MRNSLALLDSKEGVVQRARGRIATGLRHGARIQQILVSRQFEPKSGDGPVRRFLKELIWMPVGPVTNWLAGMKIAAGISALIISRRRACFQKNSYTLASDGERSAPRGLLGQDD